LRGVLPALPALPRAIVVISAHWEQPAASVTANPKPELIYDYSGFPPETYALQYPAPGDPALAVRVRSLLESAGIPAREDRTRGFDHGIFVPFLLVAPEARIPIVALSLVAGLDAATHIAIGQALAPLRDEGILIAGSGMSYHNMAGFLGYERPQGDRFDAWLGETVAADDATRRERLIAWQHAPQARLAHPREEHLLPLMVVAGAAGTDAGTTVFQDRIMQTPVSAYRFG
jgi:aromatic ring-opening dioxygenase catalytic subunit (LigB family)